MAFLGTVYGVLWMTPIPPLRVFVLSRRKLSSSIYFFETFNLDKPIDLWFRVAARGSD